ncbi:MAG: hypothetical protein HY648_02420 [Acidobacteria bacterium]|nr:hypothetical protein [Acidobacteriota bacterium]
MPEAWPGRPGHGFGRFGNPSRSKWLAVATGMLGIALQLGCGVPGEPLPPLLEIPQPVRDLSAVQVGADIHLKWSVPQLTTEGTRVRRLDRLEVYAVFAEPDRSPPDFAERAERVETIPAPQLSPQPEPISYPLPLSREQVGRTAWFAVKAVNDRGRDAGFSNTVAVEITDLPEPPTGLQATLTENAIRLRWTGGERSIFGGSAPPGGGYQILRGEGESSRAMEVLATTPATEYEDTTFQFGQTYEYSIRAIQEKGDSVAATPLSGPVQVVAADRFPPTPPQNLRAIAVSGAVEMSWSPNTESDLAGYNVYRSQGGPFQRLNPELLSVPLFRDTRVERGRPYRYQVRAADRDGNESDSSEEVSLTAE